MPNANDRWISDDTAVPEYVAATELVLQRQLAPHTRFTGSLYHYRRSDLPIENADGDEVPEGSSRARGVEAEIEHVWKRGTRARASVAWQRSRDVYERDAVNSPDLLGKLAFTFLLGCGNALNNPAWQSSVGDMVPRPEVPAIEAK